MVIWAQVPECQLTSTSLNWKNMLLIGIMPLVPTSLFPAQSSAVITRSNIVRYYINNYRTCARISISYWIHKRHPIHRPNGWAMRCLLWENWPRYNGTTLYQVIQVKLVSSSVLTVQLFRVLWARCEGANHTMVLDDLVTMGFKEPLTKPVVIILDMNR